MTSNYFGQFIASQDILLQILTLYNQTSHYKSKCSRIPGHMHFICNYFCLSLKVQLDILNIEYIARFNVEHHCHLQNSSNNFDFYKLQISYFMLVKVSVLCNLHIEHENIRHL